jgi:hypothetical protein
MEVSMKDLPKYAIGVIRKITCSTIAMILYRNWQRELVSRNGAKGDVVRYLPHSKAMLPFKNWEKIAKDGKI